MFGHDSNAFPNLYKAITKYIIEPKFKDIIYKTPGDFGCWFARVVK